MRGDQLSMTPRVPSDWPGFELSLRLGGHEFTLQWCGTETDESTPTMILRSGEWIQWTGLSAGAVARVTSVAATASVPQNVNEF